MFELFFLNIIKNYEMLHVKWLSRIDFPEGLAHTSTRFSDFFYIHDKFLYSTKTAINCFNQYCNVVFLLTFSVSNLLVDSISMIYSVVTV